MSELITWEEALWTQEAMGLNNAEFARLLGVTPGCIAQAHKRPLTFLRAQPALMLTLGVNRGVKPRGVSKITN